MCRLAPDQADGRTAMSQGPDVPGDVHSTLRAITPFAPIRPGSLGCLERVPASAITFRE